MTELDKFLPNSYYSFYVDYLRRLTSQKKWKIRGKKWEHTAEPENLTVAQTLLSRSFAEVLFYPKEEEHGNPKLLLNYYCPLRPSINETLGALYGMSKETSRSYIDRHKPSWEEIYTELPRLAIEHYLTYQVPQQVLDDHMMLAHLIALYFPENRVHCVISDLEGLVPENGYNSPYIEGPNGKLIKRPYAQIPPNPSHY